MIGYAAATYERGARRQTAWLRDNVVDVFDELRAVV
jgi:hypothetical protein